MMTGAASTPESALGYRGWQVVAACFSMAVFSWAFGFYGQGVFLARLHALYGWPVAQISAATTTYYLLSAVLVAFVGDAVGRVGPRLFLISSVLCLAGATALLGQVTTVWQLYAVYLVMAVGWAGTGVAAITTTVGRSFDTKRGLAISLALNGASVGGIVGVPALVKAIDEVGLASAVLYGGLAMVVVLVPVIALLVREPHGRELQTLPRTGFADQKGSILRALPFWTITGPFAAGFFVQVGFIVHQFPLLESAVGPATASAAVGLTASMAVLGRLALGTMIDRIDQRLASALCLASQAAALGVIAIGGGPVTLLVASALFGLSVGNVITLPALIIHREFPPAAFARTVALSTAIGQLVYAFGPGAVGWLRDRSGGYGVPLLLCAAIDLGAAATVLIGRRPFVSDPLR